MHYEMKIKMTKVYVDATGSPIAMLNDTCDNLIQIMQLARR